MKKIDTITSSANSKIKDLRLLALKKYRQETGSFLVENFTIIKDALASSHDFETLFITEDFINKYPDKFTYLEDNSQASFFVIDENDAEKLLDEAGWKMGPDGIRTKGGKKLTFTLMTTAGNKTREPS